MVDVLELKSHVLESAKWSTILRVFVKIISFGINGIINRQSSANVAVFARYDNLYSASLSFSREPFRKAVLSSKSPKNMKRTISLILRAIPLTLVTLIIMVSLEIAWGYYMELEPPDSNFMIGIGLTIFAILIEVIAESPYMMAELNMWSAAKVIEILNPLIRIGSFICALYIWRTNPFLIYGCSYLFSSILYFLLLYSVLYKRSKTEHLKNIISKFRSSSFSSLYEGTKFLGDVDEETWQVTRSFLEQELVKVLIGQVTMMNLLLIPPSDQGVFQIVNNLGSLAPRMIFLNLEIAAYKFFALSLHRGIKIKNQKQENIKEVGNFLHSILKKSFIMGLFIMTFGWAYSYPLLNIYAGSGKSSSGYGLLRFYFIYIMLLALNGVTEAFSSAVMSEEEINNHGSSLSILSFASIAVAVDLTFYYGAYGIIFGNCFNMILRIILSFMFIIDVFDGSHMNPLQALMLPKRVLTSFLLAFVVTSASEIFLYPSSLLGHLLIGGVCFVIVIYLLRYEIKEEICSFLSLSDRIASVLCSLIGVRYNRFLSCTICYIFYKEL